MSNREDTLMFNSKRPGRTVLALTLSLSLVTGDVMAALHDLTDAPLFVVQGADPNIVYTLDDSGSMTFSYLPDSSETLYNTKRGRSAKVNTLYYDPNTTYTPPVDANGNSLGNSSFTAAWNNGYKKSPNGTNVCTVNLSNNYKPTWSGYNGSNDANNCDGTSASDDGYGPEYATARGDKKAFYYVFDSTNSSCNGTATDEDCYDEVIVSSTSGPGSTDERTNFANWYSYYRKRVYLAKAATSLSFTSFSGDMRLGYQSLNTTTTVQAVAPFEDTADDDHRSDFFTWLFAEPASGGTPLRLATKRAGDYFSQDPPYREDPSDSTSEILSCRQNFHILFTDGYWNGSAGVSGNVDNTNQTLPTPSDESEFDITTYTKMAPYKDSNSSFLADNTFYYWYRDLRTGLDNNVPTSILDTSTDMNGDGDVTDYDLFWNPKNNPAEWQHMSTYTIGLGIQGTLNYPEDYSGLLSGTKSWSSNEIDDLWHAAINSRGSYLSAQNSADLVTAFQEVVYRITELTGSYAPVTLNTGTISSDTYVYFTRFETNSWIGHLLARPVSDGSNTGDCVGIARGELCPIAWDAGCLLTGGVCTATDTTHTAAVPNNRVITTASSGAGIAFRWASLSTAQKNILKKDPDGITQSDTYGQNRLNFLRGDRSEEMSFGGLFRNRQSVLGDTMASNPLYIGKPSRFYPGTGTGISELTAGSTTYAAFRTANENRTPIVYVGANDGMLHGFRATDGVEVLSYIPEEIFGNLTNLSDPAYVHTNYVDGPMVENDVFFSGAWRSVLVSGLGLGGQGYFALNVTSPSSFSENNASSIALWEFSDDDDVDMGYSYARPSIVRMANGKWVAIFGNGVNSTAADGKASTTGNAVLFIVDIQTGAVIKKLDTKVGSEDDPEGNSRPNGILGVFSADLIDQDFVVDRLYATDMFGNVWAFDVSSSNPNQWGSAYKSGSTPVPLYSAEDSSGDYQPITSPPVAIEHPMGGALVLFGTGQYLGSSDVTDTQEQTYYGIWDQMGNDPVGSGRDDLLEQTIEEVAAPGNYVARIVSDNPITWDDGDNPQTEDEVVGWYMDLPEDGERVFQRSIVRNNRLIMRTATPADNRCDGGGSSWLMELNPLDGSRLDYSVFDLDSDGDFDGGDQLNDTVVSGIQDKTEDVNSEPAILDDGDGLMERKYYTSSDGSIKKLDENPNINKRVPWRQIR